MNSALAATLDRWGLFSTAIGSEDGYFANHCSHCRAVQDEYLLHSEPGSIEFTAVEGRIRASGDCGFEV
jgi:hypothetical protein